MAALTGTRIYAGETHGRDMQSRLEVWEFTTTTTGAADEWVAVGSLVRAVCGAVEVSTTGVQADLNVVRNASGTSVAAGTNPGNLAVEANTVSGTHTWNVTIVVRP